MEQRKVKRSVWVRIFFLSIALDGEKATVDPKLLISDADIKDIIIQNRKSRYKY